MLRNFEKMEVFTEKNFIFRARLCKNKNFYIKRLERERYRGGRAPEARKLSKKFLEIVIVKLQNFNHFQNLKIYKKFWKFAYSPNFASDLFWKFLKFFRAWYHWSSHLGFSPAKAFLAFCPGKFFTNQSYLFLL